MQNISKRLLSLFMVIAMVLSMVPFNALTANAAEVDPANAVAKIGNVYYETLADAVAAAKAGDTVILTDNLTLTSEVTISKEVTIDLGGFTLDSVGCKAIVTSGSSAKVTVKNGEITSDNRPLTVNSNSTLILGENLTVSCTDLYGIYVNRATLLISEPTVKVSGKRFAVGVKGGDSYLEYITISAGAYSHELDAAWVAEGSTASWQDVDGKNMYVVTSPVHEHNWVKGETVPPTYGAEGYTIYTCACGEVEYRDKVPALVGEAKIGDKIYDTLADAIAAAETGDTVVLTKDLTLTSEVTISKEITIDLGGFTLDSVGCKAIVTNGSSAKVTVKNGEITSDNRPLTVNSNSTLILGENLTVSCTDLYGIFVNRATLLISEPTVKVSGKRFAIGVKTGDSYSEYITVSAGAYSHELDAAWLADGYYGSWRDVDGKSMYVVTDDPTYGKVAKIGDAYYENLQAAINAVKNGETITLLADVTEKVTITEKVGLTYTIDGNGNTLNGNITVNSLSDTNDNRRITIQNVRFYNAAETGIDFITSVNTNHYPRLTVKDCQFVGNGKNTDVAIRLKSSHSVVIEGCSGSGLHSFLQNTSGWNLTISGVTVIESKGGLALGTVQGVTVKGCDINVKEYGIRLDANTYNNNAVIEDCKVNAFIPVVVRNANTEGNITVKGNNTMTATNTDGKWLVIGKTEYEENGKLPEDGKNLVTVTLSNPEMAEGVHGRKITGSVTSAFTSGNAFWGEGGGNAYQSLVVKLYEGDKVIATASLNNIGGIIDGDVGVTWNIPFTPNGDSYWNVVWAEGYPSVNMAPNKVAMIIDGVEVATNTVQLNAPDDLHKIVAAATKNDEFVGYFTKVADAIAAGDTVYVREGNSFKKIVAMIGESYYETIDAAMAAAKAGDVVTILAGNYTVDLSVGNGITLAGQIDSEGVNKVNITGQIAANTGATVKNLNVHNEKKGQYDCALSVNGKDIVIDGVKLTGYNAMRNCYATGKVTIKNSVLNGSNYAIHFDGKAGGEIVLNNCDITGWCAYAGSLSSVSYKGCEITSKNGHRYYNKNVSFEACTFADNFTLVLADNNAYNVALTNNTYGANFKVQLTKSNANIAFTDANLTMDQVKAMFTDPYRIANGNVTLNNDKAAYVASANGKYYSDLQTCIDELPADGKTYYVYLRSDVELKEPVIIPAGKKLALNMNGKTINVAFAEGSTTNHIYAFTNNGDLTIEGNGTINARGIFNYGNLVLEKATINAIDGNGGYGVRNYPGATFTMKSGTIATTLEDDNQVDKGGYDATTVRVDEGATFTMNGGVLNNICDYTFAIENHGTAIVNDGTINSVHSTVSNYGSLTINGGTFTCNGKEGVTAHTLVAWNGSTTTINGGTFDGKDNYNGFNVDTEEGAKVEIKGGTFLSAHSGSLYGDGTIAVSGGTFFDEIDLYRCADGFIPAKNAAGTYDVICALSGNGTVATPYLIRSAADLKNFRDSVNAGETKYNAPGVYVALAADIDLAGINWVGIGSATADHGFMGNFDGNGYKIKNLTITDPTVDGDGYAYAGLFSVTEGAAGAENVIKNLIIENVTISTTGDIVAAAIAYPYYTTVENITVCGDINISGGNYTAGALAYTRRCVNASNVTVSGNVGSTITGKVTVGGVISDIQMNGGLTANYSNFAASGLTIKGEKSVGGIAGIISKQALNGATVKNVTLVCGNASVGTVAGSWGDVSTITDVKVENVTGATAVIGATYKDGKAVEAKIGDTYYSTFAAAYAAAKAGETVTLIADIDASEIIVIDKAITLDGGNNTLKSTAGRAINVSGANGVTIKNLTIQASGERAINVIQGATNVTIDNVTATSANYTVNLAGSAANAVVAIKNSNLTGLNVVNVAAKNADVTIDSTTLTVVDNNKDEGYTAICLNKDAVDGKIVATNTTVNLTGSAQGGSKIARNGAAGGYVSVNGSTEDVSVDVAYISYGDTYYGFATIEEAIAKAEAGETVVLLRDVTASEIITINKAITLDGNGNTLTSTAGRAINVETEGEVTIKNLTIKASGERAINIINKPATVVVENVTATAKNYAVMIATSAGAVNLTVNNSELTGLAVVNVAGAGAQVVINDTTIINKDAASAENYGAISIFKTAENAKVTVNGGKVVVADDSVAASNGAQGATVTFNGTVGAEKVQTVIAYIGDAGYTSLQSAANGAKAGEEIMIVVPGTYKVPTGKDLVITGAVDGVAFGNIGACGMNGANVTFNNVTFNYAANSTYQGLQHSGNLVYNNCTFNGQVFLYGQSETFNNCIFNNTGDNYNVWTYSAKEVAFNECTFNCDGKSVLIYAEGANVSNDVTVTNSTFKASKAVEGKAAIEMDSSLTAGIKLTVSNSTATGFGTGNVSGNSLWNNKKGNNTDANNDITVVVGDEAVLAPVTFVAYIGKIGYTTLADAFAAVKSGETVKLNSDIVLDSETYTIADGKSVTLDMNGKKITVTDNKTPSYELFYIYGEMTVTGNGTIEMSATNDRNWDASSSIFHNRGGVLNIENGTFTHKGGTDMAYVVDNSGNWYGDATTNIKAGALTSSYIAIRNRMEQNSHGASGTAYLNVYGGTINGTSRAIWAQAASTSTTAPATGAINISGGEIGLIDTARSAGAESMTTITGGTVAAFKGEVGELAVKGGTLESATIMDASGNQVEYAVTADGLYVAAVAKIGETTYETIEAAIKAAKTGETVKILPGTYAVPSMKAGITVEGIGEVLLEGTLSGTLENLTLKNLHIKGGNAQRWAYAKGDLVFENVTFEATSVYALHFDGIAAGTNLTYKDCTIIGWAAMGGTPASCVFDGCTIKGNGAYGVIRTYFPATIKDCTFDVANVNTTDVYQDGIHAVEGAKVTVTGCTNVNGEMEDLVNIHAMSVVVLDGKEIKHVAKVGGNYYRTLQEAFAAAGTTGTITLVADVDLAGAEWTPVDFNGVFDGNNHTISNLVVNGAGKSNQGFFGTTQNGEIKNVTFENAEVTGYLNVGVVAGQPYTSKYTNVKVTGHVEVNGYAYVGGVGGKNAYANWTDITVDVDSDSYVKANSENYRTYVGGVVGFNGEGGHTFKNISSNIKVIGSTCDIGGLFGIAHYGNKFENVTFNGSVVAPEGAEEVGGIAGVWHNEKGQTVTFTNAVSTGSVTVGTKTTNGSIVGGAYNAQNETAENSGSLMIDGKEAWICIARIGEDRYATLEAAIAAAQAGDVIELVDNVKASEVILIDKSLTINGHGHEVTSNASRVFRVTTSNVDVTLNEVNMVSTAVRVGTNDVRGISIDIVDNVKLTLNNCSVDFTDASANDWAYAVNVTGGDGHALTINGGSYEGANVINVRGANNTVVVKDATLNCQYPNNDLYAGACIWVLQNQGSSVEATGNTFNGSNAVAFNLGTGTALTESNNTDNTTMVVAKVGGNYYTSLADAFAAAQDGDTIKVLQNTEVTEGINNAKKVILDLNGKTITGTDNATGSFAVITNKSELTITGNGTITLKATNNRGWNAYSSVISNTVGGKLIVENGTIQHLGGTDMAYAIDNLTNGKGTYAETVINGGTIKSTYRAIRQFLNGIEAQNILTVNGGTIEGANKSIWMQDPSKNANTGALTVGGTATLNGDVYLSVTAGSTAWPVEVSIAAAAVNGEVLTNNVPAGYELAEINGNYTVMSGAAKIGTTYYETIDAAIKAAQAGETVTILAGTYTQNLNVNKAITVIGETDADGNKLVNINGKLNITANGATVKNLNVKNSGTACYVGAKDVLIVGCELVGSNGLYQSYTSGTVTFRDSIITGGTYGIHFDGSAGGEIVIDNCVITGWTSFAKTIKKVTMTDTKFEEGNYNYVRFYQENIVIDGCTFNEKMAIDLKIDGSVATVDNSTFAGGNVEDLFSAADIMNCDITVDGKKLVRVAKIGEVYYETLTAAIAAAKAGDIITLVADVNENVNINKAITLDGNGFNYSGNMELGKEIAKGSSVTIENVKFVNGYIYSYNSSNQVATLTVKNCSFDGAGQKNYAINPRGIANIVVENCTAENFIYGFFYSNKSLNSLTVKGLTVTGMPSYVICVQSYNKLVLEGIKATNCEVGLILFGNTANTDITIKDCELGAKSPIEIYKGNGKVQTIKFKGVNDVNTTELNLGDYGVIANGAQIGTKIYESMQAAIDAAQDGDTIKLICDLKLTNTDKVVVDGMPTFAAVQGKKVTIDLNGKNINANTDGISGTFIGVFSALNDGNLTIVDSKESAKVNLTGNAYAMVTAFEAGAFVTINGGSFYAESCTSSLLYSGGANGLMTVNGGSFKLGNLGTGANGSPWIFNTYQANQFYAKVNGGTFNADVNHQYWACEVLVPETKALQNNGDGTWTVVDAVAYVVEAEENKTRKVGYATLAEAWASEYGNTVVLVKDIDLGESVVTVAAGQTKTLDLNGKTLSGTDTTSKNYGLIQNNGTLTVTDSVGTGKITVTATIDSDWGRYSAVISNNPGGKLIVENGTIEHRGGTDMAYGIDSLTNGNLGDVSVTINGGTIKSTYRGIRQFLNSASMENVLAINGGVIEGTNKSIFFHDPSKKANTGKLTVGKDATLNGDVYLYVTEGSTAWPVEVSIAEAAVNGKVISANVPETRVVVKSGSVWTVIDAVAAVNGVGYTTLEDAVAAANAGDEVKILKAGTYKVPTGKNLTITGTVAGVVFDNIGACGMNGANVTFNNVTFNYAANSTYKGLQHSGKLVYNDCTINGQVFLYGQSETFNNCTFNNTGDNYNVWTYGAQEVAFNNCTFNCDGKSVLIYAEGSNVRNKVTVNDSTFNATAPVAGKAAIEMDSSMTAGIDLTINGATVNGFGTGNVSGNSLWNNKKGTVNDANNDITVTVNGTVVLKPVTFVAYVGTNGYTTLAAAVAAAEGQTVKVVEDVTVDEIIKIEKAITIDLNGNTVTGTAKKVFEVYANATIKNGSIIGANRCVDTRKAVALTLTDVNLTADKYTSAFGNPQPLTIGGADDGTVVVMTNVNISAAAGYGIITFVETKLKAENCTISGYNALYVKDGSEKSEFTFVNSKLSGSTGSNDVAGNSFSVLAVHTDNVYVYVDATSTVTATGNYMYALSLGSNYAGEESVNGAKVTIAGKIEGNPVSKFTLNDNEVSVNAACADKLKAAGYSISEPSNGMVKIIPAVTMYNRKYQPIGSFATLHEAIAAAEDDDIIVLNADLDVNPIQKKALAGKYDVIYLIEHKAITIDLNGKTINASAAGSSLLVGLFATDNGGHLTLKDSSRRNEYETGEAQVNLLADGGKIYAMLVAFEKGTSIKVNGGCYYVDKSSDSLIYTDATESVIIDGGKFILGNVGTGSNGSPWIFNAGGQNDKHVNVWNGTFNADIRHQYYVFEVQMASNIALEKNADGTWSTVRAVCYVMEPESNGTYVNPVGYASLEEAVAVCRDVNAKPDTWGANILPTQIVMLRNVKVSADLDLSGLNIDLNGCTITDKDGNELVK